MEVNGYDSYVERIFDLVNPSTQVGNFGSLIFFSLLFFLFLGICRPL